MVKGRIFLLVTTVSAWANPSAVLEPREGTPCLSSCEENPSNDSCKLCCEQVQHEVDWKCGAALSNDKAACCENWNKQCWNVASDQNLGHACNQCGDIWTPFLGGAAPSDGDGDGNDDDKDSDTSDDSSDSERTGSNTRAEIRDTVPEAAQPTDDPELLLKNFMTLLLFGERDP